MKKIFGVFIRDIKMILRRPFAVLVMLGVILLPSLYAWPNIYACWDPYSNTGAIHVAVANCDEGALLSGAPLNVGDMMVSALAQNHSIGWEFVTEEEARGGVDSGKYYAAVLIPTNFSHNMTSILDGNIQSAEIIYLVNQKKNAIAPKITDAAMRVLKENLESTFIDTASQLVVTTMQNAQSDFSAGRIDVLKTLQDDLATAQNDLGTFANTIDGTGYALSATGAALHSSAALLPQATAILDTTLVASGNTESAIEAARSVCKQLTSMIKALSAGAKLQLGDMGTLVNALLGKTDAELVSALSDINAKALEVKQFNESMITLLNDVNGTLSTPSTVLQDSIAMLQSTNAKLDELMKICNEGIKNGVLTPEQRDQLTALAGQLDGDVTAIETKITNEVVPLLNSVTNDLNAQISSMSALVGAVRGCMPGISTAVTGTENAVSSARQALRNVNSTTLQIQQNLQSAQKKLQTTIDDDTVQSLLAFLDNDPARVAAFLSSPVTITEQAVYQVPNYGSGMAPFYTVLCLWVGAIILAALVKTDVKDADTLGLKPWQCYFGRYLLFFFVGLLQAVIVSIGDLYWMKIQCTNVPLFFLSALIISVVFTLLVYTLVVSFGDIGKAIAVVLLVIQVAGAGGTFPTEVLPQVYQRLNPMMPFVYGIDAMRETVAGLYGNSYWVYLRDLVLYFVPLALLQGLVLRKPFIRLKHYLERKLEETEIL